MCSILNCNAQLTLSLIASLKIHLIPKELTDTPCRNGKERHKNPVTELVIGMTPLPNIPESRVKKTRWYLKLQLHLYFKTRTNPCTKLHIQIFYKKVKV